jgi:hypothetical protein
LTGIEVHPPLQTEIGATEPSPKLMVYSLPATLPEKVTVSGAVPLVGLALKELLAPPVPPVTVSEVPQVAVPPAPVKYPVHVVLCVRSDMSCEPLGPTTPTPGVMVPVVAFVLVHERVALPPGDTTELFRLSEHVGVPKDGAGGVPPGTAPVLGLLGAGFDGSAPGAACCAASSCCSSLSRVTINCSRRVSNAGLLPGAVCAGAMAGNKRVSAASTPTRIREDFILK